MPSRKHKIPHSPITPVHRYITRSKRVNLLRSNAMELKQKVQPRNSLLNYSQKSAEGEQLQIEVARKIDDNQWADISNDFEFNGGLPIKLMNDENREIIGELTLDEEQSADEESLEEEISIEGSINPNEEPVDEEQNTGDGSTLEEEISEEGLSAEEEKERVVNEGDAKNEKENNVEEEITDEDSSAVEEEDDIDDEKDPKKLFSNTEFKCQNYYGKLLNEQQRMEEAKVSEEAQKKFGNFMQAPKNFRAQLKEHQSIALRWMNWREQQGIGGILADEMGLGKTISMLALIQQKKNQLKNSPVSHGHQHKCNKKLLISQTTLIICPSSLIGNWEMEIENNTKLNCIVFHGAKRPEEAKELVAQDCIIMTYDTLLSEFRQKKDDKEMTQCQGARKYKIPECPQSILTKICWKRIVLDEVHHIRNKNALKSISCMRLEADHRWVLSGTLIHNKLKDLFPIMRFLRLPIFANNSEEMDYKMLKQYFRGQQIIPKYKKIGMKKQYNWARVNTLLNVFMLARTKEDVKSIAFTKLHEIVHKVIPKGVEADLHSEIMKIAKKTYVNWLYDMQDSFIDNGNQDDEDESFGSDYSEENENPTNLTWKQAICNRFSELNPLELLTRLRQISVHFSLISKDNYISNIREHWPETRKIFDDTHESPKMKEIVNVVKNVVDSGDKCVIMSQWSSVLEIIEKILAIKGIQLFRLRAEVTADKRAALLNAFNSNVRCKVLLIGTQIGAEGLNLQGANHLIFVEPHWNPQVEKQAANRLHRIGQKKDVTIHRFIMPGTENHIQKIQQDKLKRIQSIFEGAKKCAKGGCKLNVEQKRIGYAITGRHLS